MRWASEQGHDLRRSLDLSSWPQATWWIIGECKGETWRNHQLLVSNGDQKAKWICIIHEPWPKRWGEMTGRSESPVCQDTQKRDIQFLQKNTWIFGRITVCYRKLTIQSKSPEASHSFGGDHRCSPNLSAGSSSVRCYKHPFTLPYSWVRPQQMGYRRYGSKWIQCRGSSCLEFYTSNDSNDSFVAPHISIPHSSDVPDVHMGVWDSIVASNQHRIKVRRSNMDLLMRSAREMPCPKGTPPGPGSLHQDL